MKITGLLTLKEDQFTLDWQLAQLGRKQNVIIWKPAIAAMHGPRSVFNTGCCTITHCDAGGVSLVDQ